MIAAAAAKKDRAVSVVSVKSVSGGEYSDEDDFDSGVDSEEEEKVAAPVVTRPARPMSAARRRPPVAIPDTDYSDGSDIDVDEFESEGEKYSDFDDDGSFEEIPDDLSDL